VAERRLAELEDLDLPIVLVERGLEDPATLHEFVGSNHAAGARAALKHLRGLDEALRLKVTAVICFPDREATLLLNAALAHGIEVPGDLSVISYDDEVADLSEVPLTAVSPAKLEVGRLAVELLRARIADPDSPRRQESLVPRLVVRESTGPARQ
jgi:GntR family transcriptional regulator of arabinose operon